MNQPPARLQTHPVGARSERSGRDAALVVAQDTPATPPRWWPSVQPQVQALAPVALQAGGRALFATWTTAKAEVDPAVLGQVALEAVRAAGAVAVDSALDGRDRLAAAVVAGDVFAGLAAAREREELARDERADKFTLGALFVTVAGVVVACLTWRRW